MPEEIQIDGALIRGDMRKKKVDYIPQDIG
jgi:hypothetical protein